MVIDHKSVLVVALEAGKDDNAGVMRGGIMLHDLMEIPGERAFGSKCQVFCQVCNCLRTRDPRLGCPLRIFGTKCCEECSFGQRRSCFLSESKEATTSATKRIELAHK